MFSTHEGEETFFIEILKKLRKKINNLVFVIIPRHIERAERIKSLLKKKRIKYSIRSNKDSYLKDSNVL